MGKTKTIHARANVSRRSFTGGGASSMRHAINTMTLRGATPSNLFVVGAPTGAADIIVVVPDAGGLADVEEPPAVGATGREEAPASAEMIGDDATAV
ncbi:hypothetical protein E2562_005219 [Oryza meyeriana var. granulata]|uniref:Uncharacterized protein n=1 Tax=Oryza meyeriana var. granulata TaxID=110450 RepID=A0A6G1BUS4_9ORYZ|nr:hypothetical protein E2562_005219 [Oryza meyeriana var. granulata]